jgi:hypothetical protein
MAASQVLVLSLAMVLGAAHGATLVTETFYNNSDCSGTHVGIKPELTTLGVCTGPHTESDGDTQVDRYRKLECNNTHVIQTKFSNSGCTTVHSVNTITIGTCVAHDALYKTTQCNAQYDNTFSYTSYFSATCGGSGARFYTVPIGCSTVYVSGHGNNLFFGSESRTWSGNVMNTRRFSTVDCTGDEETTHRNNYTCDVCKNTTGDSDTITGATVACPTTATTSDARFSAPLWTLASAFFAVAAGACVTAAVVN